LIAGTIAELYGTLQIDKIKGVMKNFPGLTYLFIFGAIALVGIPLTTGFIGDLLIFLASVHSFGIFGIIPLLGVLLIGFLLFWLFERSFASNPETNIGYHIDKIVIAGAIILAVSSVFLGLFPYLLI
jgi:NADH:ubiquinone oxidoreductase subunit 4 (subunit M)